MKKIPLDKIIEKLEKIDIQEWKSDLYIDETDSYYSKYDQYPILSVSFYGLEFHIRKFWKVISISHQSYSLEVRNRGIKILYDKKKEQKLISNFYEAIFKNLKEFEQKEFEKKIKELENQMISN